ncbi:hypothetical protein H4R24_004395 [Coemansia sp. RSA 988]|nr:hypothetical protein H4R24_004395 [Coemansia sp. RSA 988]
MTSNYNDDEEDKMYVDDEKYMGDDNSILLAKVVVGDKVLRSFDDEYPFNSGETIAEILKEHSFDFRSTEAIVIGRHYEPGVATSQRYKE